MKPARFVCSFLFLWLVLSQSEDLEVIESALSDLHSDAVASNSTSNPVMVPLTLIHGADSKGAGIYSLSTFS